MPDYLKIYEAAFTNRRYNVHRPTEPSYVFAVNVARQIKATSIVDIGSGRGCMLTLFDPAIKIISVDLRRFHNLPYDFITADLSTPAGRAIIAALKADLVTCNGVLEHLDESFIDDVITAMSSTAPHAVIMTADHSDIINGVELHTLRRPPAWWRERFERRYKILNDRPHYNGRSHSFDLLRI